MTDVVEVMARTIYAEFTGLEWETSSDFTRDGMIRSARASLTALESAGWCVVKKQSMQDQFAEIEDCITSVQGALRHYQQPQDVHFHRALKACRDGVHALSAPKEISNANS